MRKILLFFDKLEDRIRFKLSHYPVLYGLISGVGVGLFFRGIWLVADRFPLLTGEITLTISLIILLSTGSLVGQFLNDHIIISGITQEKKLVEKTEKEIRDEMNILSTIEQEIKEIHQEINILTAKDKKIRLPSRPKHSEIQ